MFLLSVLLFWIPSSARRSPASFGGRKVGGVGKAIAAVFLPGVVFGITLFALAAVLLSVPLLGAIAGFGGFAIATAHVGPLLLGAIVGGATAA